MSIWESYGQRDPYFGVLASERFRGRSLSESARREFFQSGRDHVARVLATLAQHFPGAPRATALEFGCGVGRIAIPLAAQFDSVVGVDISRAMLEEAQANAARFGVANLRLHRGLDELSGERFSLVHAFLVFQHVRPREGLDVLRRMLALLAPGGCGALHLLHSRSRYRGTLGQRPLLRELAGSLRRPFRVLRQKLTGADPDMHMYRYPLNKVLYLLHDAGVQRIHVELTRDTEYLGAFLYFAKDQ